MNATRLFLKYVSQNVLGMIGISVYILADTLFISLAEGANGITALNLVLPVYNLIFAIGSMIAVGSATRFKILRAQNNASAELFFTNGIFFTCAFGLLFLIAGICFPGQIVSLLGGTSEIVAIGTTYTKTFMLFSPFFMTNYVFNAFIRNDGAPTLAMTATLVSSIFNIVFDYILMFPLHMGMMGAALATGLSPIVGILICSIHFFSKKNTIVFKLCSPSPKRLLTSCQLGISAFIGEIASGVTTLVFNFLILKLAGNSGVAAYGIIANTALVAVSIFNGVSQGSQPLVSEYYGKDEQKNLHKILRLGIATALVFAVAVLLVTNIGADGLIAIFNHENSAQLAAYAKTGIRLYFIGFLFAGFNIFGTGYLSATDCPAWAFATSIMRGIIAIILCALILSSLLGLNGVWLAFPAAELITAVLICIALFKTAKANT